MIDYCRTDDEVAKNPEAEDWCKIVAAGNVDAYQFAWRLWCFNHMFDDLVDQDKQPTKEQIFYELVEFVKEISFNPFYNAHKESIFPLLVSLANRTLDGDEMEKSESEWDRQVACVVRCGDLDVFLHIAYLAGGWDHMRKLKNLRTYDKGE
jgi:hypothetical protein